MTVTEKKRWPWPGDGPAMVRHHDEAWGVPVHNNRMWFAFMVPAVFQAGGIVDNHRTGCFRHAALGV